VEERFLLYGIAFRANDITPRNAELTVSVEPNLADSGETHRNGAAMGAGVTTNAVAIYGFPEGPFRSRFLNDLIQCEHNCFSGLGLSAAGFSRPHRGSTASVLLSARAKAAKHHGGNQPQQRVFHQSNGGPDGQRENRTSRIPDRFHQSPPRRKVTGRALVDRAFKTVHFTSRAISSCQRPYGRRSHKACRTKCQRSGRGCPNQSARGCQ
jgi:hypothetical protein